MKVESILSYESGPYAGVSRTRRSALRKDHTETENAVSNDDLDRRDDEQYPQQQPKEEEQNVNEGEDELTSSTSPAGSVVDRFA